MKRLAIVITGLVSVGLFLPGCGEDRPEPAGDSRDETEISSQLEKTVIEQLQAYEQKDIQGIRRSMHPDSPGRKTLARIEQILQQNDMQLAVDPASMSYIGADDEYAVLRVTQITTNPPNTGVEKITSELIHIFRKDPEDRQWKFFYTIPVRVKTVSSQTRPVIAPSRIIQPPPSAGENEPTTTRTTE